MRHEMQGFIGAAGFASGDRVVIGHWLRSPVGPMTDVMWADPDGTRTLFAPTRAVADFITAIYCFDAVRIGTVSGTGSDHGLTVTLGDRGVDLAAGPGWHLPAPWRPAWFTRWVEGPIARATMGVRTYGVSPTGVREWYRADTWRPVQRGLATIDGRDLGALGPVEPSCGFGFSEPPRRPSITAVRPLIDDPSGGVDEVVAAIRVSS